VLLPYLLIVFYGFAKTEAFLTIGPKFQPNTNQKAAPIQPIQKAASTPSNGLALSSPIKAPSTAFHSIKVDKNNNGVKSYTIVDANQKPIAVRTISSNGQQNIAFYGYDANARFDPGTKRWEGRYSKIVVTKLPDGTFRETVDKHDGYSATDKPLKEIEVGSQWNLLAAEFNGLLPTNDPGNYSQAYIKTDKKGVQLF